jgi:hypothetical protein
MLIDGGRGRERKEDRVGGREIKKEDRERG